MTIHAQEHRRRRIPGAIDPRIIPPPLAPEWYFTTDLDGWVWLGGSFTWFSGDGSPSPGCVAIGSETSTGESPEFDSSAQGDISVTFRRMHIYATGSTLALDVWDGNQWVNFYSEWMPSSAWLLKGPYDLSAYANPAMKLRARCSGGSGMFRLDTVIVSYA